MKINLNGEEQQFQAGINLAQLVDLLALDVSKQRFAIEINEEIIAKSQYANVTLSEGDRVEVVSAVGGG